MARRRLIQQPRSDRDLDFARYMLGICLARPDEDSRETRRKLAAMTDRELEQIARQLLLDTHRAPGARLALKALQAPNR